MNDIRDGCLWIPADLPRDDSVLASVFVMSLPDGIAVRFTEYQGANPAARRWLLDWLEARRDDYRRRKVELDQPTGEMYLIAGADSGGKPTLFRFGSGNYPVVPEEWPEVALDRLFARAIEFLKALA